MELVLVTPFTKIIFHVDNGLGSQLSGTGLAAEYDFKKKQLIWRRASEQKIKGHERLMMKILSFFPLTSPLLIVPILYFVGKETSNVVTPIDRMGTISLFLPIILGILLFFSFEYLMLLLRDSYKIIPAPSKEQQLKYLMEVNEISWRHNDVWPQIRTPYLANIIIFSFVIVVIIPLMFWLYLQVSTFGEMILKLAVLGLLVSIIPNLIWNGIIKVLLIHKLIKNLKGEQND